MKITLVLVIATTVAAALLASSNRSNAQEKGPYITRQPSNSGGGEKAGVVPNQCPDTYYISAFQTIKDNLHQRAINVWCKPLPKVDTMPIDLSEKGPFNTKEPSDTGGGPKVECPDGYYASAFAFRVDAPGLTYGQRSIDFWCKPFPKVDAMPADLGEKGPGDTGYDPHLSGGSRTVRSPDGYFISAIQILQGPNPRAVPVRRAYVWYRPVRQN
jgi:hypothetical protein